VEGNSRALVVALGGTAAPALAKAVRDPSVIHVHGTYYVFITDDKA
jgi:hypothetical protein